MTIRSNASSSTTAVPRWKRHPVVTSVRIAKRWVGWSIRSIGLTLRIPAAQRGLLSIVVPVYGVEKYVRGAIRSLLDQDYKPIEIIVVDDESPDGSVRIVNSIRWRNPAVRVIRQKNAGLGAARNTGARHARGEYLMFFDSDDKVTPWAFSSAIESLERSGSDFAVAPYDRLSGTEVRPAGHWIYDAHERDRSGITLAEHPDILVNMTAWSKVYRRSFWETNSFAFPTGVLYEDQAVSTRAYATAKKFDVLAKTGVLWRIRGDRSSISQQYTSARNVRDHHVAVRESLEALAGDHLRRARHLRIRQLLANDYAHPLPGLADFDAEAWQAFREALQYLVAQAEDIDWREISARNRVMYDLVLADRRDKAVEFLELRGRFEDTWPSTVVDGVVFADLPLRSDHDLPINPESFVRSRHDTRLRSAIVTATWPSKDRLELRFWTGITNVAADPSTTIISASLVADVLPIRLPLEVRPAAPTEDEINRFSTANVAAAEQFYSVTLPLSGLPVHPVEYGVMLELTVDGITRTRLMHMGNPVAPTRVSVRNTDTTWDLHANQSGFATIQSMSWRARLKHASVRDGKSVEVTVATALPELALVINGGASEGVIASRARVDPTTGKAKLALNVRRAPGVRHSRTWRLIAVDETGERHAVLGTTCASTSDADAFLAETPVAVHRLGARVFSLTDTQGTRKRMTLPAGAAMIRDNGATVRADGLRAQGGELVMSFTGVHIPTVAFVRRGSVTVHATVAMKANGFELRFPEQIVRWGEDHKTPWRLGRYPLTLSDAADQTIYIERPRRQIEPDPWLASTDQGRYYLHGNGSTVAIEVSPPLGPDERGAFHRNSLRKAYLAKGTATRPAILFRNLYGDAANDTAKAVHEYLHHAGSDLDLLWAVKSPEVSVPDGATRLLEDSTEYWDAFASSKYVMVNVHQPDWFEKKPGQVLIQTFHGYPFKLAGRRHWAKTGLSQARIDSFYKRALAWDYLLSPAPYATPLLSEFLPEDTDWQGQFLEIGYPRNDVLVSPPAGRREGIRSRLGILPEQTAVLYAPTYRDYLSVSEFSAKALELLDADRISRALGDQFVVLTRGHVMNSRASSQAFRGTSAIDVTEYPDVNDLIIASDAAILDYSSLRFDYALTGKPMIFLNPDRERYFAGRDPMVPYAETAPGPWVGDTDAIVQHLRRLGEVMRTHAAERARFRATYLPLDDGQATRRLIDVVFRSRDDA